VTTPTTEGSGAGSGEPALRLESINKAFGDSRVLRDVSLELGAGKVVALLGENGSGKSTLIKILSGYYDSSPGSRIIVAGDELAQPMTPERAHAAGLRFVHQDLGLVESMSIADNVCFAAGYSAPLVGAIAKRATLRHVKDAIARFGLNLDPRTLVADLSPAQRTMVAIARALDERREGVTPRVLVLDEPTASLPASEVGTVFDTIRRVTDAGGTVLYVSHRIDEVLEIADELIVLRDGKIITHLPVGDLTHDEVVALLLGRALERVPRRSDSDRAAAEDGSRVVLRLDDVSGRIVQNLDLELREGEILGIGGLSGCGRSELVRLIAGAQPLTGGTMRLRDAPYRPSAPRDAIRSGVTYVPEDRRNHGCIGPLSLRQNITILSYRSFASPFWIDKGKEKREVTSLVREFDIRPPDLTRPIGKFSGGNQQKAVLAKSLRVGPAVLLLDEPTQGIDVGAKNDIGSRILDLARGGMAVVLASSEASELAALCDRLVILDRGRIKTVLTSDQLTPDEVTYATLGASEAAIAAQSLASEPVGAPSKDQ
jgi:ribose transport system ATP-binding protein